jgi:hypothetical protein
MGFKTNQKNGGIIVTDSTDLTKFTGARTAVAGLTSKHFAFGPFVQTVLTLDNVAQAVVNGTEYQGTKLFTFPETRMWVVGTVATLQQKTTSAILTTLNSGTGAIALGTATASNVSLTGAMVDFLPSTAFTSSTVINTAGTAVTAVLAAAAFFDGTGTAKDLYLNTAYATTTDVDADATQTISGTIRITWLNLGDK